ncbi:lysophospholipid acyltransferase family protein [Aquimarina sp. 2201CG14-23]|uniref:lysophospholipid acyltransferase family protein n=1 Tax=Aquimarina mycalae TaxID=3040073 RepID=UPI0024782C0A|nr:lysophospholipid acyltransferase family protein [Aquimarina sp. 2201CG14-23]MDH7444002.1 lysophospholipid acyltransferase family protein [Aquimarina sp. 2201CG14-23]
MQLLVYRLVYPLLWIISKLPWRLFYLFSTCVYILVYHITRYRRKTVTENLVLVFPEKPLSEIQKIRKAFYKHMCDMFLEMIKSISISDRDLLKRFKIVDIHTLKDLEAKNKSIVVLMAHYASYEWATVTQLLVDYPTVGVYKKIKNKYFDQLVHRIRQRYDARLISSYNAMKEITRDKVNGTLCSYAFLSDQSPSLAKTTYWTDFMDIKVPTHIGGAVLAKRLDMSVVYLHVEKVKRGYYEAKFVPITENAKNCEDFYIVKTYLRMLEEQIRKAPEYYLWTHKRWKHRNAEIPKEATID